MLFFILWAVLLLSVVLSVPIVAMVESSRRKRALAAAQGGKGAEHPEEGEEAALTAEEAVMEVQVDEGAAVSPAGGFGGDDFSAFDDAFESPKK